MILVVRSPSSLMKGGKPRAVGYVSPGGYEKTAKGWRKVYKKKGSSSTKKTTVTKKKSDPSPKPEAQKSPSQQWDAYDRRMKAMYGNNPFVHMTPPEVTKYNFLHRRMVETSKASQEGSPKKTKFGAKEQKRSDDAVAMSEYSKGYSGSLKGKISDAVRRISPSFKLYTGDDNRDTKELSFELRDPHPRYSEDLGQTVASDEFIEKMSAKGQKIKEAINSRFLGVGVYHGAGEKGWYELSVILPDPDLMKKSIQSPSELAKAKGMADGTIREWSGKKYVKQGGKWKPYREGAKVKGKAKEGKKGTGKGTGGVGGPVNEPKSMAKKDIDRMQDTDAKKMTKQDLGLLYGKMVKDKSAEDSAWLQGFFGDDEKGQAVYDEMMKRKGRNQGSAARDEADVPSKDDEVAGEKLGSILAIVSDKSGDFTKGDAEGDEVEVFDYLEKNKLINWDPDDHPVLSDKGKRVLEGEDAGSRFKEGDKNDKG